jgi:hypothetical protein
MGLAVTAMLADSSYRSEVGGSHENPEESRISPSGGRPLRDVSESSPSQPRCNGAEP